MYESARSIKFLLTRVCESLWYLDRKL